VLLTGCQRPPAPCLPGQYGLTETVMDRTIAEQALLFVNLMLPPEQPLRLKITWPPAGYFPRQVFAFEPGGKDFQQRLFTDGSFDQGVAFSNADEIPTYLIDGQSLGAIEVAFVPQGCRCIFINERSLDNLFQRLFIIGKDAAEQHGDFDKALALSLVLVHELGHLRFGDQGSYSSNSLLDLGELNLPSARITNPEMRADVFASEAIQGAWSSREMHSILPGPYGRAAIASHVFRVISNGFNGYDLKNDPQGVFDRQEKYGIFLQKGYSHLNLYLRLLIFLQRSEPTDDRLHYLERIAARERQTG
jgi:hypothetical protein